ncbi:P-loop NTPase family protein [Methylorubrum extorquens]
MQYRLIELARARFRLSRIDLINGHTPITRRQAIANGFQRHLGVDEAIDLVRPKAAGTGLTLTAANHITHLSR